MFPYPQLSTRPRATATDKLKEIADINRLYLILNPLVYIFCLKDLVVFKRFKLENFDERSLKGKVKTLCESHLMRRRITSPAHRHGKLGICEAARFRDLQSIPARYDHQSKGSVDPVFLWRASNSTFSPSQWNLHRC